VKKSLQAYHQLTKAAAFLLLMAFLLPTGLHAKQLVDICLGESGSIEMAADHSCCEPESNETESETESHQHHDCEWTFICACHIGDSALEDSDWIVSSADYSIHLAKIEYLIPFITAADRISESRNKLLSRHDPPLWLVYDTFLN
jgi:hypothetical protein